MSERGNPGDLLSRIPSGEGRRLPPVHLWNPPFCGDIDMRIARDGTWYYLGSPIGRKPMVKLFSSVLRKDGDDYFLVTPVEKVGIRVDDAPFVAVTLSVEGEGERQRLRFTTQVDDEVVAGRENPLRVELDPLTGEPSPYLHVRAGLDALIHRNLFYQLVDLAVERESEGRRCLGVWSDGVFFPLGTL